MRCCGFRGVCILLLRTSSSSVGGRGSQGWGEGAMKVVPRSMCRFAGIDRARTIPEFVEFAGEFPPGVLSKWKVRCLSGLGEDAGILDAVVANPCPRVMHELRTAESSTPPLHIRPVRVGAPGPHSHPSRCVLPCVPPKYLASCR